MDPEAQVAELVLRWQQAQSRGESLSVEELCRDSPDLASEVARRLESLARIAGLAGPDAPAIHKDQSITGTTQDHVPPDTTSASASGTTTPPPWVSPHDVPDDVLGTLPCWLGGFHLLRRLGKGGMGLVYHAHDPRLDCFRAVKVMKPNLAAHPETRRMFLEEARAAARIQHPNVVPIFHADEDPQRGIPYFVMELLEGESLRDRLDREPIAPLPLVLQVGRETALGLAAAHAQARMHRDVKPDNIWLKRAKDGELARAVLLDFGLARPVRGDPAQKEGTPGYMSPEQWAGGPLDYRTDLFSLGCVLYRMTTGTKPFPGRDASELSQATQTQQPAPVQSKNPTVPQRLARLIERLLEKEPARRPATAREVADELAALGSARGLLGRRGLLIGAAVAGLLTVGIGAWLLSGGQKAPEGPPAYRGSVDLLVLRLDGDGGEILVPLSDARALPLRPGDHFKITAQITPNAYLYLFWIDEKGQVAPVYPWTPGKWGTRPAIEKPVPRLDLKAPNGNAFKVTGSTAGMETILMLARSEPLTASDAEVQGWFAGLKPLPLRGEKARVWFENFDVLRSDAARSFSYDDDLQEATSPLALQAELQRRLGTRVGYSRAISFARLGKKEGK